MTTSLGPSFFLCKRGINNTDTLSLSIVLPHHGPFFPLTLCTSLPSPHGLTTPPPKPSVVGSVWGLPCPPRATPANISYLFILKNIYLYLAALDLVAPQGSFTVSCGISPHGPRVLVLSSSGSLALLPHGMWDLSTLTRDRTCVPCIARQILNHQIRY